MNLPSSMKATSGESVHSQCPSFLYIFIILLVVGVFWAALNPALASDESIDGQPSSTPVARIYFAQAFRQPTPTPTPTRTPTATPTGFPSIPGASFAAIPVDPYQPPDRIDYMHADWNLELRGWAATSASLQLVDYNGDTDGDPPQLATLFSPQRYPQFGAAYRVYNWIWAPPPDPGYRDGLLTQWPVTLIQMQAALGEIVHLPYRAPDIYQGNYRALVLYATGNQITINYTREGGVVHGFTIHISNIWVDPRLVDLYNQCNVNGRYMLPGLNNGQPFGRAKAGGILVAIRDSGTFMDPRSRKDWWQGY